MALASWSNGRGAFDDLLMGSFRGLLANLSFATLSRLLNGQVVRLDRRLGANSYFRRRHAGLVEAAAEAECKNAGAGVVREVLVGDATHRGDHQVCRKNGANGGDASGSEHARRKEFEARGASLGGKQRLRGGEDTGHRDHAAGPGAG